MSVPAPIVKVRPRVTPTELQFWWSPPAPYWVAVGYNSLNTVCIAKSTDGMTWTNSSNNPFSGFAGYGIAWNGSYWVAVGYNSGQTVCIAKSTDAMTWTNASNNPFTGGYGNGIAWNGSYWVAVGNNSGSTVAIAKSPDGMTWTDASNNPFTGGQGKGIAWNGSYWVAVGNNSGSTVAIAKSPDGMTWTDVSNNPFTGGIGYGIAWNGSYWVAVGYNSDQTVAIAKSTDAITWTDASNNPFTGGQGLGISWNGSYWVAVGNNNGSTVCIAKSPDGMTWTNSTDNLFNGAAAFGIASAGQTITGVVLESASPPLSYTLGPTVTTKTVTGLTNLTDYSFTIKTDINGSYSDPVPFRTVRTSDKPQPVATLTKSESIVNGLLSITVNWTNPGDYAYYYVYGLRYATGTKDSIYEGTTAYGTLTQTFTDLDPARSYAFHIQRGNDAGYSPLTTVTTTATPFDPRTVTGLQFWADATDVSGNGSSVADGSTVGVWKDKSGHLNDASGVLLSATVQTDAVGRYLDLSGCQYDLSENTWLNNNYFTIFVVDKPVDYVNTYNLVSNRPSNAGTGDMQIYYDGATGMYVNLGTNSYMGDQYLSLGSQVNLWCFTNYGGVVAYYNKMVSGQDTALTQPFVTGTQLCIGDVYNGRMREILMYSGTMTEEDREAVQTYLYNKWMPQPTTISFAPVQNSAILWLDAQDLETMFHDASGTIPITTGNTVLLWKDKSGFGNDINDISGVPNLLYSNQTSINNLPGISVNNPGEGVIQTSNYIQTGDVSVFIVGFLSPGVGNIFTHDGSGNFGISADISGNLSWHESVTTNNNRYINNLTPFIFHGTMKKGQLLTGTYMDASGVQTNYTIDTLVISVGSAPIKLGTTNPMEYGEVIYYNRVLTDAEIQINVDYLSNKWNIHAPTAPTFSPPLAPGLEIWLDSSDPYTVFETDGTLTLWKDRSGNNHHATAHGGPAVADGVFFDGSGQWLSLPDGALPLDNYSYYIVSDFVSDSAIVSGGSTDVSGQLWVAVGNNGGLTTTIATSTDGLNWISATDNPFSGGQSNGIAWNGSYWVAVGNNNGSTVCIAKSPDGMTWTNSTDNPFSGNGAYKIGWNGSYWVAVGNNYGSTVCIAISTDGMGWSASTINPFLYGSGYGIAWNGSYWVAVGWAAGNTNCIATSSDGDTWASSSSNPFAGGQGHGIAWNGSYWVAVGYNSGSTVNIATSSDGDTWTNSDNPFAGGQGRGIAWNGSYWVAVGYNSSQTVAIAKSTDAMTWTDASNNPFTGGLGLGIAWNGSYWVAVGVNSGYTVAMATSTDGMTWTNASNNPFTGGYGYGIASGIAPLHNEIINIKAVTEPQYFYVAGGKGTPSIVYSTNGVTWTGTNSNNVLGGDCYAVLYAGGLWLAGGSGIAYSEDGIVWNLATGDITAEIGVCYGIVYGGGKWVAGVSGTYKLAYSTDGMNWSATTNGDTIFIYAGRCNAVAYGNSMWVAGGYSTDMLEGNNTVAYSTDGMAWTVSTSGSNILTDSCKAVGYGNGLWVAGGSGTNTIIYSEDGMTWTTSTNGISIISDCLTVAYGNGLWVAGGAGTYTLAYSTDGITWTGSSSGTSIFTASCRAVSYNGKWIAGGPGSTVAYSTDGMTWGSVVTVPITSIVQGVGSRSMGTARVAQTTFNNDYYDPSGTVIPNRSVATDNNDISGTRVIESIYNGTGKRLYLSGKTGATDTSNHVQDASNNLIGKDLSGNYMHGSIKEMLVYNTAHTDAQRKQVETYLKTKWSSIGYTPTGTSLWLDGATATNFELSGNRIKAWNDKSAAGLDMSQNLVWAQPRYSLDSVTGRYGVQFGSEGITTGFTTPSSPFGNTNSWSVFTVQRYDFSSNEGSDLPGSTVCAAYDISGDIPRFGIGTALTSTPSSSELYFMNSINTNSASVEIHKLPVLTSQVVNSLSYNDYYNGISFTNTTLSTSMTTNSILNMGFSGTITPALAGSMRGYIYEFIAYNHTVYTAEQQAVEGYLAWKWGIQNSLPTTHPYYVGPP